MHLDVLGDLRVGTTFEAALTITANHALPNVTASLHVPPTMRVVASPANPGDLAAGEVRVLRWRLETDLVQIARVDAFVHSGPAYDEASAIAFFGAQEGVPAVGPYLGGQPLQASLTAHVNEDDLVVEATYNVEVLPGMADYLPVELKLRHRVDGKTVDEPIAYGRAGTPLANRLVVPLVDGQQTYRFQLEYQATIDGYTAHRYDPSKSGLLSFLDLCWQDFRIDLEQLDDQKAPCAGARLADENRVQDTPGIGAGLLLTLVASVAVIRRAQR